MFEMPVFPESAANRDEWILLRRPMRNAVTAHEPYAFFVEEECGADGQVERVATIFLTNRECPFRCTMCDLWRNTLTKSVPVGAIPKQIEFALNRLEPARSVKLYNSGSFFDPSAIPPEDYEAIASRVRGFERVIVECHPAFVNRRCIAFRDFLRGRLEVAMGLETAHQDVLEKLNKRMTLEQFGEAALFLRSYAIDLRVFILVQPPFMKVEESLLWAKRSLDFAFDCAATAATLIPTRGGNGAMEALAEAGMFVAPELKILEDAAAYGLGLRRGRVFTDLWDVKRGRECVHCFEARVQRMREINLLQALTDGVHCDACGDRSREAD
ncbi:MAG: hypothetical protein WCA10_00650 [Terracidiphilus sp.]